MDNEKEKETLVEIIDNIPDENYGILVEDFIKIWDPESGEIQFEGRG